MSNSARRMLVCAGFLSALSSSLFAVDGVVLIDQNRVLAGNITPGDTPGFPVTLSQPGSYKLTGNLTVPDINTNAILVTADFVTIDLNGFSIIGPMVCTSSPAECPAAGTGVGILSGKPETNTSPRGTKVLNGNVRGMGGIGIEVIGTGGLIDHVTADSNGTDGIITSGTVVASAATMNGRRGIFAVTVLNSTAVDNQSDGIVLDASAGVGTGNLSSRNGGVGIVAPNGTVTGNTVALNKGLGITAVCPASIVTNTVVANLGGSIQTNGLPGCVLANNATRP